MMHVDDWLDTYEPKTDGEHHAKEFLEKKRAPAHGSEFTSWTLANPLFCTYEAGRYRCTGASRMGDVWLAKDLKQTIGYDHRVDIEQCTDWSAKP